LAYIKLVIYWVGGCLFALKLPSKGIASLVAGIVSANTCENTVRDSRIVTPEIGSKIQALESIHKLCCSNPQICLCPSEINLEVAIGLLMDFLGGCRDLGISGIIIENSLLLFKEKLLFRTLSLSKNGIFP